MRLAMKSLTTLVFVVEIVVCLSVWSVLALPVYRSDRSQLVFAKPQQQQQQQQQQLAAGVRLERAPLHPLDQRVVQEVSSAPLGQPSLRTSGTSCTSGAGVEVSWTWFNQTSGIVVWQFYNPTSSERAVVLNRGAKGNNSIIESYTFGGAYTFAYLGNGLATLAPGPYPTLEASPSVLPVAIIDKSDPDIGFLFTIRAGGTVSVEEGGFVNLEPFCDSVPDVSFAENADVNITYAKSVMCEEYYFQEGSSNVMCSSNPLVTTWPIYQVANGSVTGQNYIIMDSNTQIEFLNVSNSQGGSSSGFSCFPGDATVTLSDGQVKPIHQLKKGDWIYTLSYDAKDRKWSRVSTRFLGFLDHKPAERTEFLRITLHGTDSVLEITPDHLLAVVAAGPSPGEQRERYMPARLVVPGAFLFLETGELAHVRSMTWVQRTGAFGPLTEAGTLLVDGVLVSCYAHTGSHEAAHMSMWPLRVGSRLSRWLNPVHARVPESACASTGMHPYARVLLALQYMLRMFEHPRSKQYLHEHQHIWL